jgi:hypothetical protein
VATDAHNGRIVCPRCGEVVLRPTGPWEHDALVACRRCGWRVRWGDYLRTYQHKHLVGGGALPFHEEFVARFERAGTPQEKMLAIDRLIHAVHWELVSNPGRSAARELIYARNNAELLSFLNTLAYGEQGTPGLQAAKAQWDDKLDRSEWHRKAGLRPKEG